MYQINICENIKESWEKSIDLKLSIRLDKVYGECIHNLYVRSLFLDATSSKG